MVGERGLAAQLGELARALQDEVSFDDTLATIVTAALDLIPGAAQGSISVVEQGRSIRSHAASGELPVVLDTLQQKFQEGPCWDAVWEQRIVRVPDFRDEDRWPRFSRYAAEAGATGALSFQLWVQGENLGALNLYGAKPHAFDPEAEEIGLLVGAHAAVAFADAKQISELHQAVATRDVIGQAKGILMERYKITDQRAFPILSTVSQRGNIKLRDVADQVASTGNLPRSP